MATINSACFGTTSSPKSLLSAPRAAQTIRLPGSNTTRGGCSAGAVFVAMKGGTTDGNRYVEKAIAAGALGIITDSAQTFDHLTVYQPGLAVLEVEHGRRALGAGFGGILRPSGAKAGSHRHHRH